MLRFAMTRPTPSCARQGNVYVWKIKQGNDLVDLQPVTMFNAHNKYLTRCLLSPDTK